MYKEAGFDDAIKTVVKKVDFKNKPFETLFGVLGTSGIFFASWKLGIIAFIADSSSGLGSVVLHRPAGELITAIHPHSILKQEYLRDMVNPTSPFL